MFRDLPKYGSYKVAGDWLAEVPISWSWKPARTIFAERKDAGHGNEQMLSVTIGRGVISQADLLSSSAKKDSSNVDKSKYKLVEPGDVVYNKMRAWQGAAGGSSYRGIVSPAYVVMTPRNVLTGYMHHILRTPQFAKEAERWSYGITSDQWSLRPEHFKMIRFPVPSSGEQAAIVKYLAHADARIDNAITAKRRLIDLLEEQYTAQVVGIFARHENDAIPSIPLKRLAKVKGGMTPSKENQTFWGGDIPWVSPKDVKANVLLDSIDHITQEALDQTSISLVPRGAVVVVVRGMILARTVPVATLGVMSTLNQDMKALVPHGEMLRSDYLRDWLRAHEAEMIQLVETAGHGTKKLDTDRLMNLRLPVPALDVQKQLSARVDAEGVATKTTVMRIRDEITLLQEFRTRLVADVVTGQVDVRGFAATLPDAPEPFDNLISAIDDDLEEALSEGEE